MKQKIVIAYLYYGLNNRDYQLPEPVFQYVMDSVGKLIAAIIEWALGGD